MMYEKGAALSPGTRTPRDIAFRFVLIGLPVLIAIIWGPCSIEDQAYAILHCTSDLVSVESIPPCLWQRSPWTTLLLTIAAFLKLPPPEVSLTIGAVGWGITALAIYNTGRALHHPLSATIAALLVAGNPFTVVTLGSNVAWVLAWIWMGIDATLRGRRYTAIAILALTLATHGIPIAPLEGHYDVRYLTGESATFGRIGLFLDDILLPHGILYWLFLPWVILGALQRRRPKHRRSMVWVGLWALLPVLSGGAIAEAMLGTLVAFLTGIGIHALINVVKQRYVVQIARFTTIAGLVLGLPLGVAEITSLAALYPFRPLSRCAMEQQVGAWLRANTTPAATLFASERIGYWADRETLPWPARARRPRQGAPSWLRIVAEQPPNVCITYKSLSGDRLLRSGWLQDGYQIAAAFSVAGEATAPFTIWTAREGALAQPANARFSVPNLGDARQDGAIQLLSYAVPEQIKPGETFDVRLYWTLDAAQSINEHYNVFVHLLSGDGQLVTNHDGPPGDGWHPTQTWTPGDVVRDVHPIATPADLPAGAYTVQVGLYHWPSLERLPVRDASGVEQPDGAYRLQTITVDISHY